MLEHLVIKEVKRRRGRQGSDHEPDVQAALRQDLAAGGINLGVIVTRGCGTLDVRVHGPGAALTLSFDRAEVQLADVRFAVQTAIIRYRSSLDSATGPSRRE